MLVFFGTINSPPGQRNGNSRFRSAG